MLPRDTSSMFISVACVQTSPISFVVRGKGTFPFFACNKGNRRRLHADNISGARVFLLGNHLTYYNLMWDPEGNSFIFPRVLILPETKSRETSGLYICYISRLSLQQLKRITGANQNSRLGTYINANLIFKSTEWMIHKLLSLYYLHFFPPIAAVFLLRISGITLKIVAF